MWNSSLFYLNRHTRCAPETCNPILQLTVGKLLLTSSTTADNPPRTVDKREGASFFQPHPSCSRSQGWRLFGLWNRSAANDIDQDGNDSEDQKYMHETAQSMGSKESQETHEDENYLDFEQH